MGFKRLGHGDGIADTDDNRAAFGSAGQHTTQAGHSPRQCHTCGAAGHSHGRCAIFRWWTWVWGDLGRIGAVAATSQAKMGRHTVHDQHAHGRTNLTRGTTDMGQQGGTRQCQPTRINVGLVAVDIHGDT